MLVIVAPGQGAQAPGFLTPWLEIPGFADRLSAWSEIVGLDLIAYGTTASAEEIRDTAVAQPLLVAAGARLRRGAAGTVGRRWRRDRRRRGRGGGHSVGEFTAAVLAGVLTPEQALTLIRERARAMAKASAVTATGMTAVLGGDEAEVLAALERHGLTPANRNGAGQIVAGGTVEAARGAQGRPAGPGPAHPALGGRRVPHPPHGPRRRPAAQRGGRASPRPTPGTRLLQNADGAVVGTRRGVPRAGWSTRWPARCAGTPAWHHGRARRHRDDRARPGGTLTGLARRALRGVRTVALKTPDDLDAARDLIKEETAQVRQIQGAPGAQVLAFGGYQPANVVTNDHLAKTMDTSDEWIRSRVGIAERRIARSEESEVDLAVQAGGKALAASGLSASDIDLVIVATCTLETQIPNAASRVPTGSASTPRARSTSTPPAPGSATRSPPPRTRSGPARRSTCWSSAPRSCRQWVDWTDRTTAVIFADGAGAAVVGPSDTPGIGPVAWGSAGDKADAIKIKDRNSFLQQEGQTVFRWATTALHPMARGGLRARGRAPRGSRGVRAPSGQPAHHRGDRP